MTKKSGKNLIWIDLEMTGLDLKRDSIIEIAVVVTDTHLNVLAEAPVFAIHQDDELLDNMDEWNTNQHNKSGLVQRVKESIVTEQMAEEAVLDFLHAYLPPKKSPMCGNSICQDRRFLYLFMPKLEDYFHYRNLDVSTLKELAKRWQPDIAKAFKKKSTHLALQDIYDSIDELKFYREHFIKPVDNK